MKIDDRVYVIGGPPRVGKSLFSLALAKKIGGHIVSTDSIRHSIKKVVQDKESDLFIINKHRALSEEAWLKLFAEDTQQAIEDQTRESIAAWPAIRGFITSFHDDNLLHIIEGVALLPELVSELPLNKKHVVYIGNTNPLHIETILRYSQTNPELDWMNAMNYSEERIRAKAVYVQKMSIFFRNEAEKYGFQFVDFSIFESEGDFEKILNSYAAKLIA